MNIIEKIIVAIFVIAGILFAIGSIQDAFSDKSDGRKDIDPENFDPPEDIW